ncbi:MAG: UpxY family transcription antiterminator [Bacteroides sp.]|nr:UpxY family transcription antiterminator [Bacteroides sp.]
MEHSDDPHWYAMRATYRREPEAVKFLHEEGVGCFVPMRYAVRMKQGRKVRQLVPVVHNLIFVRANRPEMYRVKQRIVYLQYITDSRSGEKIIIPDEQMKRFIAVAGTYSDQLLYFHPDEVNLAKGARVRVIGGEFEGYEGIFLKVKGARDRRVVIAIPGIIAVAMATIHPSLVEVIQ